MSGHNGTQGAGENASAKERRPSIRCRLCGRDAPLQTVLGKFGKQPAYRVYRCQVCDYIDWVAVNDLPQVQPGRLEDID